MVIACICQLALSLEITKEPTIPATVPSTKSTLKPMPDSHKSLLSCAIRWETLLELFQGF